MPRLEDLSLADYLGALAAKSPTPGGGAVASTTGATAAALAGMVVAYSLGKKNLAPHQPLLEDAAHRLGHEAAVAEPSGDLLAGLVQDVVGRLEVPQPGVGQEVVQVARRVAGQVAALLSDRGHDDESEQDEGHEFL